MTTKEKIEKFLKEKLAPEYCEITDDSHLHAGHAGAKESGGGHFSVVIISQNFAGLPLIKRHRMIYDALKEIKSEIHALAIKAMTSDESRRS